MSEKQQARQCVHKVSIATGCAECNAATAQRFQRVKTYVVDKLANGEQVIPATAMIVRVLDHLWDKNLLMICISPEGKISYKATKEALEPGE